MLKGVDLCYRFGSTQALDGVNMQLETGEIVAVTGSSGSGKSTLLHCLAGLLRPASGEVWLDGSRIDSLPDAQASALRLRRFGTVLQFGEMLPELTMVENVELPLRLMGGRRRTTRVEAMQMLEQLGVGEQADSMVSEVSGGQAQRAAVARALIHRPVVVFADEPTGSLDQANSRMVLRHLVELSREREAAVLLVTHDKEVAEVADRRLELVDGRQGSLSGAGAAKGPGEVG